MSDRKIDGCDIGIGLFFGCFLTSCVAALVIYLVFDGWKSEAVKHGHAHYYLDKNHIRQWEWLPKPTP